MNSTPPLIAVRGKLRQLKGTNRGPLRSEGSYGMRAINNDIVAINNPDLLDRETCFVTGAGGVFPVGAPGEIRTPDPLVRRGHQFA